ncbi:MAG: HlyC/CorC family transporter [Chloroflexi bacterium]|nr:HlyC/CorC family transporter [Chloroflexota bacterium]
MDGNIGLAIPLLLLFLALSALFSATEAAFLSHQRSRLSHLRRTGAPGADRVSRLLDRPERLLIGLLTGNNIVNVAAAAVATVLAVHYIAGQKALLVSTLGMTLLLLVFGEIIPKLLGAGHWERFTAFMARPVEALLWVLSPVVRVLSGLTMWVTQGKPWSAGHTIVEVEELRSLIYLGKEKGTVAGDQAQLLERAFQLRERRVREVMTPRPEIVGLEEGARLRDLLAVYRQHSHTRFPVYHDDLDHVVGVVSIKDVLLAMAQGSVDEDSPITQLARAPCFVPETKTVATLLSEMRTQLNRMGIVIDEFGGVSGVVTLKQLLEALTGALGDEMVHEEDDFHSIDERTVEIDGALRIEEANEMLGIDLPEGDYETVAGFVLSRLGHIPEVGEHYRHDGWHMVVCSRQGNRIEKLRLTRV